MSSNGRRRVDTVSSSIGDPETRRRILDATLDLVARRGGADVTMAQIARTARVSRQAVYLHFADRAALITAAVRHGDQEKGIPEAIRRIREAPDAAAAVREMVATQARLNPEIWPIARALDAVRREDEAAERSWQDRLADRLAGCRAIVARLADEGVLKPGIDQTVAADLLWTLTSLRLWEDLVLLRGWTVTKYRKHVGAMILGTLTDVAPQ
jgi:AcrR family transcriptional regulator